MLPPIDITAEFGDARGVQDVDSHARQVMQDGLDELVPETTPRIE
jgi:hypothetical protein